MNRTTLQNASIHLYLSNLAKVLNDAGYTVQDAIKILEIAEISYTKENCKEIFWRRMQTALYPEIKTTTKLDTKQVREIYEHLNIAVSNAGIYVPFPSKEELIHASRNNQM